MHEPSYGYLSHVSHYFDEFTVDINMWPTRNLGRCPFGILTAANTWSNKMHPFIKSKIL